MVRIADDLSLSCHDQGDPTGPAVVLVPGPTDSWRSYGPVLDRLPPSMRAVAISPRGHGDSDSPRHGFGVADVASDAVAVMDALRIDRAVLAGHSGSCLAVRRVALDHPGRVAGLVLESSPTTLAHHDGLRSFLTEVVAHLEDPIDRTFLQEFVTSTSTAGLAPALADQLVAEAAKVPARVWREAFNDLVHYDDTAELGRIGVPTLLVWGDADRLIDRGHQTELAASIPSSRLEVYPGVGHTPRWERPDRFGDDLVAAVAACG